MWFVEQNFRLKGIAFRENELLQLDPDGDLDGQGPTAPRQQSAWSSALLLWSLLWVYPWADPCPVLSTHLRDLCVMQYWQNAPNSPPWAGDNSPEAECLSRKHKTLGLVPRATTTKVKLNQQKQTPASSPLPQKKTLSPSPLEACLWKRDAWETRRANPSLTRLLSLG